MSYASCPRTALSCLWYAFWTRSSASVVAVVFLAFLRPTTDGPAALHEITHPDTCRACAVSSSPQAKAALDASLIALGAMETPTASDGLSEGAGSIFWAALTGPRGQEEQRPGYLGGGAGTSGGARHAPTTARERTAAEQRDREK
jgi:hypothetical protein